MDIVNFTDAEREALLDLLILAMYADGHLASAEDNQVRRLLGTMGFESTYERNRQFDNAINRLRTHLKTAETALVQARQLAQTFQTQENRRQVYLALAELMASDNRIAPKESQFLSTVKEVLQAD